MVEVSKVLQRLEVIVKLPSFHEIAPRVVRDRLAVIGEAACV
jgi:hypothetical protein